MHTLVIFAAKYLVILICLGFVLTLWLIPSAKRMEFILRTIIAGVLAFLLSLLAGRLYFDPRPFVAHHSIPLIAHSADNGFPSDHMLLATLVAFSVLSVNRKFGIILLGLATLVGGARVMAGVHSPIDIIGSTVISAVAVVIIFWLPAKLRS
jgi:undecaprenyl-diphosphatase